jgi:hypothetical protein
MMQGLAGQNPPHPVIIMNPVPTPVHPMPTAFLPPLPATLQHVTPPGVPMICPPAPRPPEVVVHDHVYVPVSRTPQAPQVSGLPVPHPVPLSLWGSPREELVPPPAVAPPPEPNMPLQISATGKRVKVSCPRFVARCDRISNVPTGDRIVLEGKVRLTFHGHDAGKVSAERVEVDLIDGAVEVNPPIGPVVPVGYFGSVPQPSQPAMSRMAPPYAR